MQSWHGVGSVLEHDNRLVVFGVPTGRLIDDLVHDHVQSPRVAVPGVVAVESYDVQKLARFVFLNIAHKTLKTWELKKNLKSMIEKILVQSNPFLEYTRLKKKD